MKKTPKKPVKKAAKPAVKKAPAAKAPAAKPVKAPAGNGKRVLVVDDEPDIRSTVKTVLEKSGYSVDTAQNGDECVQKATPGAYNLILLDIMMPGMPVKDVIEKVTQTPIAFLSVVRTSDEEKRALLERPNVKMFIQKPFEVKGLVEDVRKLVG